MKKECNAPRYYVGGVVYAPGFLDDKELVVTEYFHNGLVWMYRFKDCDVSVGEQYITKKLPDRELKDLILERVLKFLPDYSYDNSVSNYKLLEIYTKLVIKFAVNHENRS